MTSSSTFTSTIERADHPNRAAIRACDLVKTTVTA
jgi:hypothetical protein